jgi:hypothetical protein
VRQDKPLAIQFPELARFTSVSLGNDSIYLSLTELPIDGIIGHFILNQSVVANLNFSVVEPFQCDYFRLFIESPPVIQMALVMTRNCYISSGCEVLAGGLSICTPWRCDARTYKFRERYRPLGRFKTVLDTSTVRATNWAHWICESLAVLVWLPPEITHSCTILWVSVSYRPGAFIPESLNFFGFHDLICLNEREYIFAEELWTLVPFTHNRPYPAIIRRFRAVLAERIWTAPMIPWKFMLLQRDRNTPRYILNMKEIENAFRTAFPLYSWQVMTYFRSVIVAAKQFYEVRLLFGVHGAGFGSLVFMQNDTFCLEIQTRNCFPYMWELTQICMQYHIMAMMDVDHHDADFIIRMDLIYAMIDFLKLRLAPSAPAGQAISTRI